jgi:hypothetical protein
VYELTFNANLDYLAWDSDECSVTETPALDGWGDWQRHYAAGETAHVGSSVSLRSLGADFGLFKVRFPKLGQYRAIWNARVQEFRIEAASPLPPALLWSHPITFYPDRSFTAVLEPSNHPPRGTAEVRRLAGPNGDHYGIRVNVTGLSGSRTWVLDLETGVHTFQPSWGPVETTPPPSRGTNYFTYVALLEDLRSLIASIAAGSQHPWPGDPVNPNPELLETVSYLTAVLGDLAGETGTSGVRVDRPATGLPVRIGDRVSMSVSYRAPGDRDLWAQACDADGCYGPQLLPVAASNAGQVNVNFAVQPSRDWEWTKFTVKLLPRGGTTVIAQHTLEIGVEADEWIACTRNNYFPEPGDTQVRIGYSWRSTELRDLRVDVYDRDTLEYIGRVQRPLSSLSGDADREVFEFDLRPDLKVVASLVPRGSTSEDAVSQMHCL